MNALDLFGRLCLALLVGCAVGGLVGLAGRVPGKLASWSGGLLDRTKRRLK